MEMLLRQKSLLRAAKWRGVWSNPLTALIVASRGFPILNQRREVPGKIHFEAMTNRMPAFDPQLSRTCMKRSLLVRSHPAAQSCPVESQVCL
jgi:hypothetical protein